MAIQAWMRGVLLLGGSYNAIWAIFLFYKGDSYIKWITEGSQQHNDWVIYQALFIFLVGCLMILSILNPVKYRVAILLVFLAKLLGSSLVYCFIMGFQFNKKFIFYLLMNDLVWLVPLGIILVTIYSKKNS